MVLHGKINIDVSKFSV
uniref:Uncharacterized protein n=1 Tax=Arundo donax TaxID=35708 RepID=A0A0A9AVR0_ARUDO